MHAEVFQMVVEILAEHVLLTGETVPTRGREIFSGLEAPATARMRRVRAAFGVLRAGLDPRLDR